jgi:hypothetical protein
MVMNSQNPLSFFNKFIDSNYITDIKTGFYSEAFFNGSTYEVDKVKECIMIAEEDVDGLVFSCVYFKEYLANILAKECSKAIEGLDYLLLNEPNLKKSLSLVAAYATSLKSLQKIASTDGKLKKYPAIADSLNRAIQYLEFKAEAYGIYLKGASVSNSQDNTEKLIWNDKINTLTTLIHELTTGKLNFGEEYIKAKSKNDVIMFIVNNFKDKEGADLSYDTIKNYLKPGRLGARAKENSAIPPSKVLKK